MTPKVRFLLLPLCLLMVHCGQARPEASGKISLAAEGVPEELFLQVPICNSNDSSTGGEFAQANVDENVVVAFAAVQFGELSDSAFAELRRDFSPAIAVPATLTFGPVFYFGALTGFGLITEASARITVTLRDETDDVELGSQVLLDESENGEFAEQITSLIDSDVAPPSATFPGVQLVPSHDYAIIARLELDADGLNAIADFSGTPVDFGCLVATAELDDGDGDGLFDVWEQDGVDVDGDGDIDVDLPSFGADPMHKDLFYELDYVVGFPPLRNDIQNIKLAFAAAPIDAGGMLNPDGQPGINVWIDTGNLTEPSASEDGAIANSCGDGVDNGGDGMPDGADPDCLVGDDFGGGNSVTGDADPLGPGFYLIKNGAGGFTPTRRGIFRYGVKGDPADSQTGFSGGRAEGGGDDLVIYNSLPGSLFHEMGHTLGLGHGGGDGANCKPNYVSVMNYHQQLGLFQTGGVGTGQDLDGDGSGDGMILDYSAPRFPGGRGQAPLITLDETDLDDGVIFDATDTLNQFAFVNPSGLLVRAPVNQPVDWDGDGDLTEQDQMIDVDIQGMNGPSKCASNAGFTADPPGLVGHDDWTNLQLPPLLEGDDADAAVNPVTDPEPGEEELFDLLRAFNTTDLSVEKSDSADPVEIGASVVYTLHVRNNGPNPASRVVLEDVLPPNVTVLSSSPPCSESAPGTITCELGELLAREEASVGIEVDTTDACVGGLPPMLSNTVDASNQPSFAGPDLTPADNEATELTALEDTTPPTVSCNAPATIIPPDAPISFTATAEDLCDDSPEVTIVEFDCFKFTSNGKKIDKTESCEVSLSGDSITISDSGGVDDHITWIARAEDASGNVGEALCETLVVRP